MVLPHVCISDKKKNFSIQYFSKIKFEISALLDVGGNVLQAASKTVGKDINGDQSWIIEVNLIYSLMICFSLILCF